MSRPAIQNKLQPLTATIKDDLLTIQVGTETIVTLFRSAGVQLIENTVTVKER
jgi:hypothetical protein